ncbi:hypothetical protein LJR296_001460 [Cupriavidus necator]|uniref:hypothetical protein n=1 Tax=Cupriavidus necator TaxID=106590 RepID=UPI003ECE4214
MQDLIQQIRWAINGHAYYLALYTSLTLPDICSAMESDDGLATGPKYKAWFDRYVASKYAMHGGQPTISGEVCWSYRCSALHQGRAQHPRLGYSRILFIEPGAARGRLHNNVFNDVLNIDLPTFCGDIIDGVQAWLVDAQGTPNYQRNFPLFMQRYPDGLAPYILGIPVIA